MPFPDSTQRFTSSLLYLGVKWNERGANLSIESSLQACYSLLSSRRGDLDSFGIGPGGSASSACPRAPILLHNRILSQNKIYLLSPSIPIFLLPLPSTNCPPPASAGERWRGDTRANYHSIPGLEHPSFQSRDCPRPRSPPPLPPYLSRFFPCQRSPAAVL